MYVLYSTAKIKEVKCKILRYIMKTQLQEKEYSFKKDFILLYVCYAVNRLTFFAYFFYFCKPCHALLNSLGGMYVGKLDLGKKQI